MTIYRRARKEKRNQKKKEKILLGCGEQKEKKE